MNNKEQNFISAVVYVRNSEKIIKDFVLSLADTLEKNFRHSEIICVNDASEDASANEIRSLCDLAGTVSISILNLSSFHGKEAAMQGGAGSSVGDFVFEFDTPFDGLDPEMVMQVYRKSLEGFDIVAAVEDKKRKATSSLFYKVFNKSADLTYDLDTEYFRILSRRAINRVGSLNKVISYRKVAYASCGLKYNSVKVSLADKIRKDDRKEKKFRRYLAVDSILLYTNLGFRTSLVLTVIMMALMIAVAVYALVSRLAFRTVPGWTSTVIIIAFGFFGLFGLLSIIIKYLQLLMDINVKKTAFTFESIEKITRSGR